MSAQMLVLPLLAVGTAPRLERDAWSINGQMTKANNKLVTPDPPLSSCTCATLPLPCVLTPTPASTPPPRARALRFPATLSAPTYLRRVGGTS